MTVTLKEVVNQSDYLVGVSSGLTYHFQESDEPEEYTLIDYDDGETFAEWSWDVPVEPTAHGTLLILGTEYRAYVAQQVKFEPTE